MSGAIVAMLSSDWPRRAPSWASRSGIISAVAAELPAIHPCRPCPTSSTAAEGQRKARARDSAHLTIHARVRAARAIGADALCAGAPHGAAAGHSLVWLLRHGDA